MQLIVSHNEFESELSVPLPLSWSLSVLLLFVELVLFLALEDPVLDEREEHVSPDLLVSLTLVLILLDL